MVLATAIFLRSSVFGKIPSDDYFKDLTSVALNKVEKRFQNRQGHLHQEMNQRNFNFSTFLETMKQWKNNTQGVPSQKLPSIRPDIAKFIESAEAENSEASEIPETPEVPEIEETIKFIWLGHSSFLLRMGKRTILVDPVFSESVSPVPFLAKRFQAPPIKLEELPKIDYILISHDHYDHLDMGSIQYFKDKQCQFVTPLGIASHLEHWGIVRERVQELDWWQSMEVEGLKFTATPSQHFSGRNLFDSNKTLWASWVIQYQQKKVYFSGDSGYDIHFKEIGERLGPFDLAFIETGQYNKKWEEVHMLPHQSAQAYFDLQAKAYVPVHWGMFELSIHSWFDPIEKIHQLALERSINLLSPKLGQMVELGKDQTFEAWWESIPRKE